MALLSRYNIYSQIVGTALSVRSHAQAKFYNGVIKFPDCDRSEMAKSVTVAAKLMKSEAIGQNRIPYQWKRILTDSAAINNWWVFLWMDDADRRGFQGNASHTTPPTPQLESWLSFIC